MKYGKDGAGLKWPPVHKVKEQSPQKSEAEELKKNTDYFHLLL